MRGLICKEFLYLKRANVFVWVSSAFLIYTFLTMVSPSRQDARMWGINVSVLTATLGLSFIINSPFCDQKSHWDRFARSLPISLRKIVGSRYLCALLAAVVGALISICAALAAVGGNVKTGTLFQLCAFCFGFPLIMYSIMLPLCYWLPASIAGITIMLLMTPALYFDIMLQKGRISDSVFSFSPLFFSLISLAAIVVSYYLSLRIYSKKDL